MGTVNSETVEGIQSFYAATMEEWREWLDRNCLTERSVWLIIYHKNSITPSINYDIAIEQALCFGWVDSKAKKRDEESFYLKFTPRNPKSKWSKKNIERATRMNEIGLMTSYGQSLIDQAKSTGKWVESE